MKLTHALLLSAAVVGTGMMFGCEADESAPTRPRTQNVLTPDDNARNNAEKRETEEQKRELPTGRSEFPGQSRVTPKEMPAGDKPVVLADDAGGSGGGWGTFRTPTDQYKLSSNGKGPVPPLNPKPGQQPTPGSAQVPGTPWAIDFDWGEIAPLENVPHRAWPDDQTTYVQADVKHNPVYYFSLATVLGVKNDGSYVSEGQQGLIDFPWFYLNTAALPVLMILEPPLQQRTTEYLAQNPVYLGHQPAGGDIVPSPPPGRIEWRYPFLEKNSRNPNDPSYNEPATTQTYDIQPAGVPVTPSGEPATQPGK
jgi:hypothetical protein